MVLPDPLLSHQASPASLDKPGTVHCPGKGKSQMHGSEDCKYFSCLQKTRLKRVPPVQGLKNILPELGFNLRKYNFIYFSYRKYGLLVNAHRNIKYIWYIYCVILYKYN